MSDGLQSTDTSPASRGLTEEQLNAVLQRLGGKHTPPHTDAPPPPASDPDNGTPFAPLRPAAPPSPPLSFNTDVFRGVIEAIPDALVVINSTGVVVLVNAQIEQVFGYQRDELLGQSIEILVPDRFRDRHVGYRNGYMNSPHVRPMGRGLELVGRRKDGHEVPIEISLSPLNTPEGLLVVASIRDVTERRKAESQLRKMEARYRTLVEGIPAVTFMAAMDDSHERELYVSPQIEELLGFSQKEWLENPILWYTQLHPDDQARWHNEFAHTCSTGEPFRSVYRFIAKSGNVVWVHGEAHVVKDDDGQPLFLQGVAFDVTGIKEAEERLQALNATLDARIAERTEELTRSNQALARFAITAAHDLKAPLITVKSFTQAVITDYRDQLEEQASRKLTRVEKAAGRMDALIDDLLAYAKFRTEPKAPAPVACQDALEWACSNLRAMIEENGAQITNSELPQVLADRTQISQVFQNLIGNALKYRADRPPQVHVSARREGPKWVIEVTDNGVGIEPQHLSKIFDLGVVSRVDPRKTIAGSGIGLATCETIVQQHGGRIWASSEGPDRGTTISFTMPAVD